MRRDAPGRRCGDPCGARPRPRGLHVTLVALVCSATATAAAQELGPLEPAAPPAAEPDLPETVDPVDGETGPAMDALPLESHGGPDEQTGYYYVFAAVATAGELFGGFALGLGIGSLVDGYDRDHLVPLATTAEDGAAITGGADDVKTLGWITLGVGTLSLGLGLALDVFLGDEFGDDDWWLRVGVTTPLATAGAALIAGGITQLDRAASLRAVSPRLATLESRELLRSDAADAETDGWILIGVGAAAIIGAAAVWLKEAFEADETTIPAEAEESGPAVGLFPLTLPGGGGLGLTLVL
jgi:hypothetical protein